MIILAIILYTLYLRMENIKRVEQRKLNQINRELKLQNKIEDFEEFKKCVLQRNTNVLQTDIRSRIFNTQSVYTIYN